MKTKRIHLTLNASIALVDKRMFSSVLVVVAVFLPSLSFVGAECPNACSSHGRCGAFDMCFCYRNWMANDCSESEWHRLYADLPVVYNV